MKQGWEIKKLGEVCTIGGGSTPSKTNKDFWENGAIPWFTIEDIREQGRKIRYTQKHITEKALNKTRLFPPKTTLLCCTASIGEYAISEVEITSNQQFNGIVVKDSGILNPYYIFYFAATLKEKLLKLSSKTTIDFVSTGKVKELTIPVPSLLEQGRIVGVLDAAFAKIDALKENAQKNLENAKALFQQVLKQELTPKPNWQTKKLGEVCVIVGGSTPKTNIKEYWENGVYNWITPADLKGEKYQGETHRKLSEIALQRNSLKILPIGSVLLSSRAPIGKVAITTVPMFTNQGFKSAICSEEINNEFLYWFLYANTDYLNSLGTGATFKEISKRTTENIKISLPPLVEQIKVVKILNAVFKRIDVLIANAEKTIAECDALKQAVLRRAFNGEL